MESTELTIRNNMIQTVDDLGRIGKMMAVSGYFQDARDAAQASVKVMAGMEMGFGPFASMTGIHIIQGRPAVGANLMASAVKSNPKYDYRVREMSAEVCKIEFFEVIAGHRESIGVSEFTMTDAKKAGVKNIDKFPRNMLFARAMSNGIRWFCPDVFAGNPTYTPEELGAPVDEEGNVITVEAPTAEEPLAVVKPAPSFDEAAFLDKFPGVPAELIIPIDADKANATEDSEGIPYSMIPTQDLRNRLNALVKSLRNNGLTEADKAAKMAKLGIINAVLLDRKAQK